MCKYNIKRDLIMNHYNGNVFFIHNYNEFVCN